MDLRISSCAFVLVREGFAQSWCHQWNVSMLVRHLLSAPVQSIVSTRSMGTCSCTTHGCLLRSSWCLPACISFVRSKEWLIIWQRLWGFGIGCSGWIELLPCLFCLFCCQNGLIEGWFKQQQIQYCFSPCFMQNPSCELWFIAP